MRCNEIVSNFGLIHVTGELILDFGTSITGGLFQLRDRQDRRRKARHGVDVENLPAQSGRHVDRDDAGGRWRHHYQWRTLRLIVQHL
jgi:hypothetical protein